MRRKWTDSPGPTMLVVAALAAGVLSCGPLETAGEIVEGVIDVWYVSPEGNDEDDCTP